MKDFGRIMIVELEKTIFVDRVSYYNIKMYIFWMHITIRFFSIFHQQIAFLFFIDLHSRSRDNKQGDDKVKDTEEDNYTEKSFEEGTSSTENAKSEIEAMLKRRKNVKSYSLSI